LIVVSLNTITFTICCCFAFSSKLNKQNSPFIQIEIKNVS
jgi:hypothetical protein